MPNHVDRTAVVREPLTAAEANRRHYARMANRYDATESCVVEQRLRKRLQISLDRALAATGGGGALRALDACGGSGNASLMLLERGLEPLTIDIAPEMLRLFSAKARARGFEPRTKIADIAEFLREHKGEWDLIVFSSALHHLDDPDLVLLEAIKRLAPGGCIVTAFDPRRVTRAGTAIRLLDYYAHVLLHQPCIALDKVRRKPSVEPAFLGKLAERHAVTGLDDSALRRAVEATGCSIVRHERYHEARFRLTRMLLRALGMPTAFGLLIQAPR